MTRNSTLSLVCFGPLVCSAPFVLYAVISALLEPDRFGLAMYWGFGLLVLPSVAVGFFTGLIGYGCSAGARRSLHWDLPIPHALIVGAGSGAFGAVPVGFLVSVTKLGLDLPMAILASGIYVFVVFTGYVLLWERRARRPHGSDGNHP